MEQRISTLLRAGVVASLSLVALGTAVTFVRHPDYVSLASAFDRLTQPGAAFPRTLAEVAEGVAQLRGQAIVAAGLLLLIATPVLRVAMTTWLFAQRKDRDFVAITLLVLLVIGLSVVLGRVAL